jgi:hypothetical protein
MLAIDMLPAGKGDCLWIEYGMGADVRRILVDGGIPGTAAAIRDRIQAMAPAICRFELLVVTHIDLDHIGGILDLLQHPPLNLEVGEVWFNGWRHLEDLELGVSQKRNRVDAEDSGVGVLGAKQGERLSAEIEARGFPWNKAFGGGPVVIEDNRTLPRRDFEGGLCLTLLSPTRKRLQGLRKAWEDELRQARWKPGEVLERLGEEAKGDENDEGVLGSAPDLDSLARSVSKEDTSKSNGSSIALLLEYDGKRCLLTGDAYARDVTTSIGKLAGGALLEIDALKLSHHGGKKNTSVELIQSLVCPRFLVSTNGGGVLQHPDPESVARAIVYGKRSGLRPGLFFNYRTEQTESWDDARLLRKHGYELRYPADGEEGLRVEL